MKKNFVHLFKGFSLAEALITLLIVCLITLASVPVITKKKRDPKASNTVHGTWMCAMHDGQYVVYDSQTATSTMDQNDPTTWSVTEDGTSCTFRPPLNAKNFILTLIGGGGAGSDGYNQHFEHINGSQSYTAEQNGIYNLAVVGAGGAGSGSNDISGTLKGVGGQGGGGAYWAGTIKLTKGNVVMGKVASTPEGVADGGSCLYEHDANDAKYSSTVRINGITILTAGNGQSGQGTKDDITCGAGGIGGSLIKSDLAGSYIVDTLIEKAQGSKGRDNKDSNNKTNNKDMNGSLNCYGDTNGVNLSGILDDDYTNYGQGGYGCEAKGANLTSTGLSGNVGTVKLWQVKVKSGQGGQAAQAENFPIEDLKSRVVITLGQGGSTDPDDVNLGNGGTTIATVYDANNNVVNVYRSGIGQRGGQSQWSGVEAVNGQNGIDSEILAGTGGAAGTCTAASIQTSATTTNETTYEKDENGEPKCYEVCSIGLYSKTGTTKSCNTTYCIGCQQEQDDDGHYCEYQNYYYARGAAPLATLTPTTGTGILDRSDNPYITGYNKWTDYSVLLDSLPASVSDLKTLEDKIKKFRVANWKPISTPYQQKCRCINKSITTPITTTTSTKVNASCTNGSDGTYFGAGGGGGGATNTLGIFGQGGNGAPGAVIIKW